MRNQNDIQPLRFSPADILFFFITFFLTPIWLLQGTIRIIYKLSNLNVNERG